jgi:hypothetical protein
MKKHAANMYMMDRRNRRNERRGMQDRWRVNCDAKDSQNTVTERNDDYFVPQEPVVDYSHENAELMNRR